MSWQYEQAFLYLEGDLMLGGTHHADMLEEYISDITRNTGEDYWDVWNRVMEKSIVAGHIGIWVVVQYNYDTEEWEDAPNPHGHKRNDRVAVFFTHGLAGDIDLKEMGRKKAECLEKLKKTYPGIREALDYEHYKYEDFGNPQEENRRWYTGVEDTTQYTASQNMIERANQFFNDLYPDEVHNLGGHCMNPKCDYVFTDADERDIEMANGWFTCPKCNQTFNYQDDLYNYGRPGGSTRAGLTMDQMGTIGENIVAKLGKIDGVGQVLESHAFKGFPIDFTIGPYGVEVKTNHSEAQARFKLGGGFERQQKIKYVNEHRLKPGLLGVRLNFYTNRADLFFRPAFTDTWIGNPQMKHVASVDFSEFNPFKRPEDVPPASQLPDDDADIPF